MRKNHYHKKIFGGTNFLVVLWTLISLFRFGLLFGKDSLTTVIDANLTLYFIPLIFLLVLNLMISVGLFFPSVKNRIWVLSVIIATVTLIVLNTFQTKVENIRAAQAHEVDIFNL